MMEKRFERFAAAVLEMNRYLQRIKEQEMRRFGLRNSTASLILGILDAVLGFYLLFNPFTGAAALMMAVGICLVIGSIQNFYSVFCISKAIRESKKDRIIDVEWESL